MSAGKRILVGTVGYHNLRNHSIGPLLLPKLQRLPWPAGVQVEELNWGPVAVAQRLQAENPPFDRIVLVGARPGNQTEGTITLYRWEGGLPPAHEVQARIGEAISGVISVDNLLIVGEYFGAWPQHVYWIAIAPGRQQSGPQPTPRMAAQVPRILEMTFEAALSDPGASLDGVPLEGQQLGLETLAAELGPALSRDR